MSPERPLRSEQPDGTSPSVSAARTILEREGRAILAVAEQLDEHFETAVSLLCNCRGSVLVSGIGKAGLIGQKLAATLASTGTRSHFLHPAEAIHGDLGRVGRDDVVLMLSQSGETEEIVRLLPALRSFGIPLIAITASKQNTLGRAATVTLPLGTLEEADPLHLAPSTSTTAMLALGDALALVASGRKGFRAEQFARFHPGGSLGRKLSRVEEYMRSIGECRVARDGETIRQVFVAHRLPGRRSGATMLVDENGVLSGIFTDSDLARLFEQNREGNLDRPVAEAMTRCPKTIPLGSKMLEAVFLMAEKKISELPVVDDRGHPRGMLDITDIVGAFPEYHEYIRSRGKNEMTPSPSIVPYPQDKDEQTTRRTA
jgi:arabinose-5-phosphate isomerase